MMKHPLRTEPVLTPHQPASSQRLCLRGPQALAMVLLACLLPAAAWAHGEGGLAHHHSALSSFIAGFTHPFSGVDHLVAMVAVGLWSALTCRHLLVVPLAFALSLVLGAVLAASGVLVPAVEPMIATSLCVIGLLVLARWQMPLPWSVGLVALFALFHGAAHGMELRGPQAAFALLGMGLATALLHALGIVIGRSLGQRHAWMARVTGAGVALLGLVLVA